MKRNTGQKGFTLIEVLIAIVVFGFSLMAIIPLLVASSGVTTGQSVKAEAYNLASHRLDEMKVLSKGEIDKLISAGGKGTVSSDSEVVYGKANFFTIDWEIKTITTFNAAKDYYLLAATVTYKYKGKDYTRTLSTLWGY